MVAPAGTEYGISRFSVRSVTATITFIVTGVITVALKEACRMKQHGFDFIAAVFLSGSRLSGMTSPEKVIGFLDVFGDWDPTLMMVMVGGILVHTITFRLVLAKISFIRRTILAATKFTLDKRLIVGSAIFGIGWGLAGFCPGPGLVSLISGAYAPVAS